MAIVITIPPAPQPSVATSFIPAIRTDHAMHGLTFKMVTVTFTGASGSTTDYVAGGFVVTPASIGMRVIWTCLQISAQLQGTPPTVVLVDPAWDHVNNKLAVFISQSSHAELTNQLNVQGSQLRAIFLGV